MDTVVLVIHLMLVAALIAIVLVQRSEGGALGIGGGGNFMATRSSGNALTRATTILAAGFFITSIGLTILARTNNESGGIFENLPVNALPADAGAEPAAGAGGVLNLLGGGDATPAVPADAGGAGGASAASAGAAAPAVPADAGGASAAAPAGAGASTPAADGGAVTPAASSAAAPVVVPGDAGNPAPAASP
jgi:preprotein translocase subunit SecG